MTNNLDTLLTALYVKIDDELLCGRWGGVREWIEPEGHPQPSSPARSATDCASARMTFQSTRLQSAVASVPGGPEDITLLGAPTAVQVADRFHLWQGIGRAVETCVAPTASA